jgi:hypothetical protein
LIAVKCSAGGGSGGTITVPLGTRAYAVPANDTVWLPTGDANSVLNWQGSIQAPDLCGGNPMDDIQGAVFTATVVPYPPSRSPAEFRFRIKIQPRQAGPNTN